MDPPPARRAAECRGDGGVTRPPESAGRAQKRKGDGLISISLSRPPAIATPLVECDDRPVVLKQCIRLIDDWVYRPHRRGSHCRRVVPRGYFLVDALDVFSVLVFAFAFSFADCTGAFFFAAVALLFLSEARFFAVEDLLAAALLFFDSAFALASVFVDFDLAAAPLDPLARQ